jgi:hypothetical protein
LSILLRTCSTTCSFSRNASSNISRMCVTCRRYPVFPVS